MVTRPPCEPALDAGCQHNREDDRADPPNPPSSATHHTIAGANNPTANHNQSSSLISDVGRTAHGSGGTVVAGTTARSVLCLGPGGRPVVEGSSRVGRAGVGSGSD